MRDLLATFGKIGLLSFGGPAAQIGLIHREVVERRKWLTEAEYLAALSLCMVLPGPEAMQLATYAGWRAGGLRGALIGGGLFVLPGALIIAALAAIYVAWGGVPLVAGLFWGLKAAVLAVVAEALLRMARRALKGRLAWALALGGFVALFALGLPFALVVLGGAAFGALCLGAPTSEAAPPRESWRHSLRTLALGAALWLAPLPLLALAPPLLTEIFTTFARLALVSFGGAYALLAELVRASPWVPPGQMIDALALAETTPGPLILVTEFVAYLAGHAAGGTGLALAAAAVSVWAMFLPSLVLILATAPHLASLTANPRLTGALRGVSAVVVGVIAALGATFTLHVLFPGPMGDGPLALPLPDPAFFDPGALALAALAGLMLARRWPLPLVLALAAACGLLRAAL